MGQWYTLCEATSQLILMRGHRLQEQEQSLGNSFLHTDQMTPPLLQEQFTVFLPTPPKISVFLPTPHPIKSKNSTIIYCTKLYCMFCFKFKLFFQKLDFDLQRLFGMLVVFCICDKSFVKTKCLQMSQIHQTHYEYLGRSFEHRQSYRNVIYQLELAQIELQIIVSISMQLRSRPTSAATYSKVLLLQRRSHLVPVQGPSPQGLSPPYIRLSSLADGQFFLLKLL